MLQCSSSSHYFSVPATPTLAIGTKNCNPINHQQTSRHTLIISIEGVDRAGKATQAKMLVQWLQQKIDVHLVEFPDYTTPKGQLIHKMLHGGRVEPEKLHRMMAENRRERLNDIKDALARNQTLVINRYCESNVVYGTANHLDRKWLEGLDSEMPEADLIILIDIDADTSFDRGIQRDAFESDRGFIERVIGIYREEARKDKWVRIDGGREEYMVHNDIVESVQATLK